LIAGSEADQAGSFFAAAVPRIREPAGGGSPEGVETTQMEGGPPPRPTLSAREKSGTCDASRRTNSGNKWVGLFMALSQKMKTPPPRLSWWDSLLRYFGFDPLKDAGEGDALGSKGKTSQNNVSFPAETVSFNRPRGPKNCGFSLVVEEFPCPILPDQLTAQNAFWLSGLP
jgi:hypothetical protein